MFTVNHVKSYTTNSVNISYVVVFVLLLVSVLPKKDNAHTHTNKQAACECLLFTTISLAIVVGAVVVPDGAAVIVVVGERIVG